MGVYTYIHITCMHMHAYVYVHEDTFRFACVHICILYIYIYIYIYTYRHTCTGTDGGDSRRLDSEKWVYALTGRFIPARVSTISRRRPVGCIAVYYRV